MYALETRRNARLLRLISSISNDKTLIKKVNINSINFKIGYVKFFLTKENKLNLNKF